MAAKQNKLSKRKAKLQQWKEAAESSRAPQVLYYNEYVVHPSMVLRNMGDISDTACPGFSFKEFYEWYFKDSKLDRKRMMVWPISFRFSLFRPCIPEMRHEYAYNSFARSSYSIIRHPSDTYHSESINPYYSAEGVLKFQLVTKRSVEVCFSVYWAWSVGWVLSITLLGLNDKLFHIDSNPFERKWSWSPIFTDEDLSEPGIIQLISYLNYNVIEFVKQILFVNRNTVYKEQEPSKHLRVLRSFPSPYLPPSAPSYPSAKPRAITPAV